MSAAMSKRRLRKENAKLAQEAHAKMPKMLPRHFRDPGPEAGPEPVVATSWTVQMFNSLVGMFARNGKLPKPADPAAAVLQEKKMEV
jgi:hypothetical protein